MSEGFTPPPAGTEPDAPSTPPGASGGASDDKSATDVAKDEASNVAGGAVHAGQQVAQTVTEQAGTVAAEAGRQAKDLLSQARSELSEQAGVQQQRVASGLRSVAEELHGLADGSPDPGIATDLARQAADKAHQVAAWLDHRDPGALLDEVRSFARQRPGAYLTIALGAGVLAGRLTRGLTAPTENSSDPTPQPAAPVAPVVPTAPGALTGTEPRPALSSRFDQAPPASIMDPVTGVPVTGVPVPGQVPYPAPIPPRQFPGVRDSLGDPRGGDVRR
jgi:hypothetical protein